MRGPGTRTIFSFSAQAFGSLTFLCKLPKGRRSTGHDGIKRKCNLSFHESGLIHHFGIKIWRWDITWRKVWSRRKLIWTFGIQVYLSVEKPHRIRHLGFWIRGDLRIILFPTCDDNNGQSSKQRRQVKVWVHMLIAQRYQWQMRRSTYWKQMATFIYFRFDVVKFAEVYYLV